MTRETFAYLLKVIGLVVLLMGFFNLYGINFKTGIITAIVFWLVSFIVKRGCCKAKPKRVVRPVRKPVKRKTTRKKPTAKKTKRKTTKRKPKKKAKKKTTKRKSTKKKTKRKKRK